MSNVLATIGDLDALRAEVDLAIAAASASAGSAVAAAAAAAEVAAGAAAAASAIEAMLPEFHAAKYGMSALATAATNKQAIDDAVAAAAAVGGGRVVLARGWHACNNLAAPPFNNVQIVGSGEFGGTTLSAAETTGDFITFTTWSHLALANVHLTSHVRRTSGWAIKLTGNCFKPRVQDVRIDYHYNGIDLAGATGAEIINLTVRYPLGSYGIRCYGAPGLPNTRPVILNINADAPSPGLVLGNNAPVKSYAAEALFDLDDTVKVNGKVWQCSQAGTTGAASAPDAIPGTAGADAFTAEVTDGGCKWKFVHLVGLIWCLVDSYTYSTIINKAALLNGDYGVVKADTANTGASHPIWLYYWDLEIDHTILDCVLLLAGEGFEGERIWLGSSRQGNGITFGLDYHGEIEMNGGRIAGNWLNGVTHFAGPVDVRVRGIKIGHNSIIGSGICHGVSIGVGAREFSYVDNTIGTLAVASWAAIPNNQGWGILISDGDSDDYVVALNRVKGNVSGGVYDGGTGVNKYVPEGGNPGLVAA